MATLNSESLSLGFGTPENELSVETSTKPRSDHLIIHLMLMTFPFDYAGFQATVEERVVPIQIMGEVVDFRALTLTKDWWCGTHKFGDRFICLRGLGITYDDIEIEQIDL
jgi:hypothetical protein